MRFRDIVFIDHEEEQDDEGRLITDRALCILHHRDVFSDSVVWECPTSESVNAAVEYLLQWDYEPDSRPINAESQHGSRDETETVRYNGKTYLLTYNVGLSYIGLEEVLPDNPEDKDVPHELINQCEIVGTRYMTCSCGQVTEGPANTNVADEAYAWHTEHPEVDWKP